jgi:hypothetical protein
MLRDYFQLQHSFRSLCSQWSRPQALAAAAIASAVELTRQSEAAAAAAAEASSRKKRLNAVGRSIHDEFARVCERLNGLRLLRQDPNECDDPACRLSGAGW